MKKLSHLIFTLLASLIYTAVFAQVGPFCDPATVSNNNEVFLDEVFAKKLIISNLDQFENIHSEIDINRYSPTNIISPFEFINLIIKKESPENDSIFFGHPEFRSVFYAERFGISDEDLDWIYQNFNNFKCNTFFFQPFSTFAYEVLEELIRDNDLFQIFLEQLIDYYTEFYQEPTSDEAPKYLGALETGYLRVFDPSANDFDLGDFFDRQFNTIGELGAYIEANGIDVLDIVSAWLNEFDKFDDVLSLIEKFDGVDDSLIGLSENSVFEQSMLKQEILSEALIDFFRIVNEETIVHSYIISSPTFDPSELGFINRAILDSIEKDYSIYHVLHLPPRFGPTNATATQYGFARNIGFNNLLNLHGLLEGEVIHNSPPPEPSAARALSFDPIVNFLNTTPSNDPNTSGTDGEDVTLFFLDSGIREGATPSDPKEYCISSTRTKVVVVNTSTNPSVVNICESDQAPDLIDQVEYIEVSDGISATPVEMNFDFFGSPTNNCDTPGNCKHGTLMSQIAIESSQLEYFLQCSPTGAAGSCVNEFVDSLSEPSPKANVFSLQVGALKINKLEDPDDDEVVMFRTDIYKALEYLIEHTEEFPDVIDQKKVLNLSLEIYQSRFDAIVNNPMYDKNCTGDKFDSNSLKTIFEDLINKRNFVTFIASGNDKNATENNRSTKVAWPACASLPFKVGAIDYVGSGGHAAPHLISFEAPGGHVKETQNTSLNLCKFKQCNTSTSQATALASGAAAACLSNSSRTLSFTNFNVSTFSNLCQ